MNQVESGIRIIELESALRQAIFALQVQTDLEGIKRTAKNSASLQEIISRLEGKLKGG